MSIILQIDFICIPLLLILYLHTEINSQIEKLDKMISEYVKVDYTIDDVSFEPDGHEIDWDSDITYYKFNMNRIL